MAIKKKYLHTYKYSRGITSQQYKQLDLMAKTPNNNKNNGNHSSDSEQQKNGNNSFHRKSFSSQSGKYLASPDIWLLDWERIDIESIARLHAQI